MRILHQSDLCTLILGDARDPHTRPDRQYDLLCTDPPYGVKWKSARRTNPFGQLQGDDGTLDVPALLGEWANTPKAGLRNSRHIYVFGYTPDQLTGPLNLGGTAELIWDKRHVGSGDLSSPWGPRHEPIAFGVHVPGKAQRARGDGRLAARLRQGSVIVAPRPGGTGVRHPTEKPVGLMTQLVESSTLRGDLVADPFAGVGSTLVAAILSGRRAYGVEIEERYATIALDRVRRAEEIVRQATTV